VRPLAGEQPPSLDEVVYKVVLQRDEHKEDSRMKHKHSEPIWNVGISIFFSDVRLSVISGEKTSQKHRIETG
jgi:hypothetical protein